MTSAQKLAKEKFKKAIAYRQKSGVSLKEAFAHVYGKKKVARKKVAKKRIAGPKDSSLVRKELARKGLKMPHGYTTTKRKRKIGSVKKKKITEKGILNRIHTVKRNVEKLDEAQHKHMIGKVSSHSLKAVQEAIIGMNIYKGEVEKVKQMIINARKEHRPKNYIAHLQNVKRRYMDMAKEKKIHITQLKKHI
jgi:hypothetical protein